ncbi:MAG TPA: bifunctional response regulator/alkaline phosphatase family protein [Tenuifilaceae bacterium]|nr:bifunctional response regulator/alkaline phosphatase family protein [Tenuifilaceae bacterium]
MNVSILWVDDEIDLLSPHIMFLEQRSYTVSTATNGHDALDLVASNDFDIVFLDENMPGISGLETLAGIKQAKPNLPVVMVTKSEEESIMDQAVGAKIADYLIKPVKPNQVLLSVKKHVHKDKLVSEKTTTDYQQAFGQIGMQINSARSFDEWTAIYRKLTQWSIQLTESTDPSIADLLSMQLTEANNEFGKFIKANYLSWFEPSNTEKPMMSHNLMRNLVFPTIDTGTNVLLLVIDNFRFDQWLAIQDLIAPYWRVEKELIYTSILPTATQYARNALFSGLMPLEIQQKYPQFWVFDEEEEGKNLFEQELLKAQIQRLGKGYKLHYEKCSNIRQNSSLSSNLKQVLSNNLTVLVYNFVDVMSHARTEMQMMRQLASDEAAYLSLTRSWFKHSDLFALIKEAAEAGVKLMLTTDHGTIRVKNPVKVVGDRATSTNLRYKLGKNLNYNPKQVFEVRKPEEVHLPKPNVSSSFIFALNNDFFAYPNNYNHYANYYRDTFQHGGVSIEEMLIPFVELKPH